jgi:hypothetical protein
MRIVSRFALATAALVWVALTFALAAILLAATTAVSVAQSRTSESIEPALSLKA